MKLGESLRPDDLRDLVKKVFEIDSFQSKIGTDEDTCVLSFSVSSEDPAKDLENFIEMGYSFVLDADCTAGELDDGNYRVYVEIERTRHIGAQIFEIVEGIKKLAGLDNMRFRYFKSFKSMEATEENLAAAVPQDDDAYRIASERNVLENFSNFFSNSYADEITVLDESLTFKRIYSGPVKFDIVTSGPKKEVYDGIKGPIILESKNMAEVMFLTKTIGNYNINKIGDTFIFERNGYAVAMKRKQ
jgi:hypothetical protein